MTSRLNLHTKLSFEPMVFRPYQTYTPRLNLDTLFFRLYKAYMQRDSLQSVENEKGKIKFGGRARNFRRARPAMRGLKTLIFKPHSPTSAFCSFPLAFERVGSKKQWVQHHAGGLSRLLTSGAKKMGHAKGEEIFSKIYSRPRKMILQPLVFKQCQAYMQRANLQSVENERSKIKFGGRARKSHTRLFGESYVDMEI